MRVSWKEGPIVSPAPGHVLCWECEGTQKCPCCEGGRWHRTDEACFGPVLPSAGAGTSSPTRCRQCRNTAGYCYVCGGAGQIPIDPTAPWDKPAFAMVNRDYVAAKYGSAPD